MAKKFDFLSPGIEIREVDQSFLPVERDAEGPIIIGRARKGPANKPIKIRNLDDFVSVFGAPVPGGNGPQGDVWREGNTAGPTYGAYAAQAWLASEESPITYVRLAGEQHPSATGFGNAGWQHSTASITDTIGTNAATYGLFLMDSTDAATVSAAQLVFGTNMTGGVGNYDEDGLVFKRGGTTILEIDIENASSAADGTAVREVNSGIPRITIHNNGTTTGSFMTLINTALELAATNNDIPDLVFEHDSAANTIDFYNLSTSTAVTIQSVVNSDFSTGMPNNFKVATVDATAAQTIAAAAGNAGSSPGVLAAVFYSNGGALALHNKNVGAGAATTSAGALKLSGKANAGFTLKVYDDSDNETDSVDFNFSRGSSEYIRNVFSTNPQQTNTTIVDAADRKTYWLGETFVRSVEDHVSVSTAVAEGVYGILLPLGQGLTPATSWGYQRKAARVSKSGWVISQAPEQAKLFRFKSHHVGEEIQRNVMIAIEDIKESPNPNVDAYASFTVCFKSISGETLEKYSNVNLNPSSPDYISKRIGDQELVWSDADKRYRILGDYPAVSDYFYVEMNENIMNRTQGLVPVGFYGPVRPTGFSIIKDDGDFKVYEGGENHPSASVQRGHDGVVVKGHVDGTKAANMGTGPTFAQFRFPSLPLRINGEEGGAGDEFGVYWGVRPKLSATSTQHDVDYIDYLRTLGMGLGEDASHIPADTFGFEYSFIFTLDDIVHTAGSSDVVYTSGSYYSSGSYTSQAGQTIGDLLDLKVRQFMMPVWGGFDGLDIVEAEPFRNTLMDGTFDPTTSYVEYSLGKALDSVADPEVVAANLLTIPGINKPIITNKMISVAERRKDVLAIIDIENDYVPRQESNDSKQTRLGNVKSAVTSVKGRFLN